MKMPLTLTTSIKITDILILLVTLFFLGWIYYTFWFSQSQAGDADTLIVQVMDHAPQYYSLQQQQILKVEGAQGISLIEIHQGKARFIHSTCRNKFCIFHGWLTTPGDVIACLPNQISIVLQSSHNMYDALNY
jgi:hypothetical protein